MEERSCFVCSLDYEIPSRRPHILDCCHKNICNSCLQKILKKKKKCPNCRKSFLQTSIDEFIVNVEIEETLNFEQFGDLTCYQCKKSSPEKASKMCSDCGLICNRCLVSHNCMKIFDHHKINPIPVSKWSNNLETAFKTSCNCETHTNQKIESFCKSCQKAVCKECILELHNKCRSGITTIDYEFEETRQKLQTDLDKIDLKKAERRYIEIIEKQKSNSENIQREIEALKSHCLEVLKNNFDAVRTGFQNKAQKKKDGCEKTIEQLQRMKHSHENLCDFVCGSLSLQNKLGFLQQAHKVMNQIEYLQNEIGKITEEDEIKKIDYLTWIKEIFNELQLTAEENASVIFALNVAEEGGYPSIIKILSQYRRLNSAKAAFNGIEDNEYVQKVPPENSIKMFIGIYEREMFPRYSYHLDLTQKMQQREDERIVNVTPNLPGSTILIYGREADVIRKLLHPLVLEESVRYEHIWQNVILVVFIDTPDDEQETFNIIEKQLNNCCWCIVISSINDDAKLRENLTAKGFASKFSFIPHDLDVVWNHLTSAMELSLIEILREKKNWSDSGFEDVQTVLKRIEKCSDFPEHNKNKKKSYDIPQNIKNVLKRFEKEIVRYGFHFEKFRVVVKNEKYKEVKESLTTTKSADFCELVVISQDDFQENLEPFTGTLKAQGRKLYQSSKSQQQENDSSKVKDYYGTLGSLALLNHEKTVALSCKHVCEKDKYVYIETEQNERISLGKCPYVSPNDPTIQSDLAIVEIDDNMEEYFSVKKLLNHIDKPTNAVVFCLENNLDIRGEIVHKLGAVSTWTQGEIVCVEVIKNRQGIIAVRGMNGKEFGKPGDSGSIVFRESTNAKVRTLEVVAVLSAGYLTLRKQEDQASGEKNEQESKLVVCSVFKDAFEEIKKNNDTIESISFY